MSDDMLKRIQQKRHRPTVHRDTSFSGEPDHDIQSKPETTESFSIMDIQRQLDSLPMVASRRNIRLLEELDSEISRLCNEEGITIESLLEALYTNVRDNPQLLSEVLLDAKDRINQRKEAGVLRRIASQLNKF